jgi:transposase-like protein
MVNLKIFSILKVTHSNKKYMGKILDRQIILCYFIDMDTEKKLQCPHCKSTRLHKTGITWSGKNPRQRYFCRECHRVTINPIKPE